MILDFLRRRPSPDAVAAHHIHAALVAKALDRDFYSVLGVPDTFPGRFEMVVLHAALYFRRMRREGEDGRKVSQAVFDATVAGLDASIREMGVGDVVVPKRMKTMTRSFYDGAATYDAALDAGDRAALEAALARIVFRGESGNPEGPAMLSDYAFRAERDLAVQAAETLSTRGPAFPAATPSP